MKRSVISAWASKDPEAAWEWIDGLPAGDRHLATGSVFGPVVYDSPTEALKLLASRGYLADSHMAQWVGLRIANDIPGADAAVDLLPPGQGRTNLISGLARALSGEPLQALAWADTLLPGEREGLVKDLFDSLGQQDPESALALANSELAGMERTRAISSVLAGWAREDFEAAFATMITQLDAETLLEAAPELFRYQTFPNTEAQDRAMDQIARLSADRREAVLAGIGSTQASICGGILVDRVAKMDASSRAAFARGAIEQSYMLSPGLVVRLGEFLPVSERTNWARTISAAMAASDLRGAASFVSGLPEGKNGNTKRQALSSVMSNWTNVDPDAAEAYLARLPPGELRASAARGVAARLERFDSVAAGRVQTRFMENK